MLRCKRVPQSLLAAAQTKEIFCATHTTATHDSKTLAHAAASQLASQPTPTGRVATAAKPPDRQRASPRTTAEQSTPRHSHTNRR